MACTLGLLSERFSNKVIEAVHDITLYSQGNDATSQGYRLDYWKQSLKAISDSPMVGHGVGSWRQKYISYGGNEPNAPSNPHQQFLLWTVEAGLIGLALLVRFFWALLKDAQSLDGSAKDAMLSALGIVLMVSLFNCPFYGAGIGEFFILIFASMAALSAGQGILRKDLKQLRAHPEQLPWIERLGLSVVTQPLSVMVGGNEREYAQSEGLSKLGWRQLRKICYLHLHRQAHLQQSTAHPEWKRGLWIYQRTPQIGDSLMDLAPRDLFKLKGIEMDLMIAEPLMPLFDGDNNFRKVYSTPSPGVDTSYDFVVIQSIHHRSLYKKIKYFPQLPWVCIQGNYDVPNFARSRFATQRLCDLFSWSLTELEFSRHAKQKLNLPSSVMEGLEAPLYPLTITLGGMDPSRIYFQWQEVISQLQRKGFKRCLLIGSGEQAQQTSDAIVNAFSSVMTIESVVNKVSLQECQSLIARTQLLITADGGLMHLGVATGCQRIISLFTKSILPSYRLSEEYLSDAIQSASDAINDIEPEWVVAKVMQKRGS
jgi:heptosyltransferase-2